MEFYTDTAEYDYEIAQDTGAVLSYDSDIEDWAIPQEGTPVTLEQATQLVVDRVEGLTAQEVRIHQEHAPMAERSMKGRLCSRVSNTNLKLTRPQAPSWIGVWRAAENQENAWRKDGRGGVPARTVETLCFFKFCD